MAAKHDAGADASLAQAKKSAAILKKMLQSNQSGHSGHGPGPIRVAMHKGHRIEVKTTYEVKIDGKTVHWHFAPDQDGSVTYHAIPTRAFASAIDLIRGVIDAFPADFPAKGGKPKTPAHDHGHAAAPRRRAAMKTRKAGN